jgi:hypothetical protein
MCTRDRLARQRTAIAKAILSVDRIRYRYGRPAAVLSIDIANWSGDRMAHWSLSDWHQNLGQHGMNHGSHSTMCAMQKKPKFLVTTYGIRMWPRNETERRSHPPDQVYAQHGQQKYSTIYFSLSLHTTYCLHCYIDRGFVWQHNTSVLDYMSLCTKTRSPSHHLVVYLFHIEPIILPLRPSTIPVLTTV